MFRSHDPRTVPLPVRINIDAVVANSFKDFHIKGFDYLCVDRSPEETVKLYFFDGDISKLPEVVAPHDHRYDFETWLVAGASDNIWFERAAEEGEVYNWFKYMTPLNGGNGFEFVGEEQLREMRRMRFRKGDSYFMHAEDLHTIRIVENETVLMLVQFEDLVPTDQATNTFTFGGAPSLDGLYSRFTADEVIAKLRRFEERTGYTFKTEGQSVAA
jgi:hypothetical protein